MSEKKRPVEIPWTCAQRGDCCRTPRFITMTIQEADEIVRTLSDEKAATLHWVADNDFLYLMAQPCPLLDEQGKCSVYDVRPYNCRRFCCYRVGDEPWEVNPDGSCKNFSDRLMQSREVRRDAIRRQKKAQRWADKHGWKEQP